LNNSNRKYPGKACSFIFILIFYSTSKLVHQFLRGASGKVPKMLTSFFLLSYCFLKWQTNVKRTTTIYVLMEQVATIKPANVNAHEAGKGEDVREVLVYPLRGFHRKLKRYFSG